MYLPDAIVNHSGTLCLTVEPYTNGAYPNRYMGVRLTNGSTWYTATGGGGISGSEVISDQGSPAILSSAWPVKITDGETVLGVPAAPINMLALSGSVVGVSVGGVLASQVNPLPVSTQEPLVQWRYDIGTGSIYAGYAMRGAAIDSAVWIIKRTNLDGQGNPTDIQWATNLAWSDRSMGSYS